jgi:hypothetical protein
MDQTKSNNFGHFLADRFLQRHHCQWGLRLDGRRDILLQSLSGEGIPQKILQSTQLLFLTNTPKTFTTTSSSVWVLFEFISQTLRGSTIGLELELDTVYR